PCRAGLPVDHPVRAVVESDHVVELAPQHAARGVPRDHDGLRLDPHVRVPDGATGQPREFHPAPGETRLHLPVDHREDLRERGPWSTKAPYRLQVEATRALLPE